MTERVVIYGRVSTTDQTSENQLIKLKEIIKTNGWELVGEYVDEGISGAKGRDKRPQFDKLCKDMVRRKFNRVMVWDVSRLGRSLQHLVEFLNDVQSVGCNLYIHQSGLDTTTPSGRMMFQMVGVFSEFERSMISERVKLGLNRVKSKGKELGPKMKVDLGFVDKVKMLWEEGLTLDQITKQVELSRSTIYRVVKGQSKFQKKLKVANV
jgi:DNA invertase Pin-like site-specific DNA recombinase